MCVCVGLYCLPLLLLCFLSSQTPQLIKLVQQYLQEKSEGILTRSPPLATQQEFTSVPSAGHQHDSDNLMKKELDKAFERISDLEVDTRAKRFFSSYGTFLVIILCSKN